MDELPWIEPSGRQITGPSGEHAEMKICIVTPAPVGSRKGNRVTAQRWGRLFRQLGHRVRIATDYVGRRCDVLVALHARRSYRSIARFRKAHGDDHPYAIACLTGLADLYRLKDDYVTAEQYATEAVTARRATLPDDHPELAGALSLLGRILVQAGQYDRGEPLIRESLAISRRKLSNGHWQTIGNQVVLAHILVQQQRYDQAEALYLDSYSQFTETLGATHVRTLGSLQGIVDLYDAWGMSDKAAEWRAKLPDEVNSNEQDD